MMHCLFPLLKNSKSGVDDRGHRLRSGSPVTNLPGAPAQEPVKLLFQVFARYFTFLPAISLFLPTISIRTARQLTNQI